MAIQPWCIFADGPNDEVQFCVDYDDGSFLVQDIRYQNLTDQPAWLTVYPDNSEVGTRYSLPAHQPMVQFDIQPNKQPTIVGLRIEGGVGVASLQP